MQAINAIIHNIAIEYQMFKYLFNHIGGQIFDSK